MDQTLTSSALSAISESLSGAAGPIAVAVSGGSDSMALLRLAAEVARQQNKRLIAATVDHGLRPEAAQEAVWAQTQCAAISAALNLPNAIAHETLRWTDPKPATGLPAAARDARYGLLSRWARDSGADRILTGHTLDDQAETVAFRIASGGGSRSAAGLRALSPCPIWPEGRGVLLARPLLEFRRADLQAWLRAGGAAWLDDPSNDDLRFARPRMRARLHEAAARAAGLGPRFAAIGARLSAAQMAVEAEALALLRTHLRFDVYGAGLLALTPLEAAHRDVRASALSFAVLAASGQAGAPARAAILSAWDQLCAKACAVSLGGARIGRRSEAQGRALLITRDSGAAAGRSGGGAPPDLLLSPGESGVFDGRFAVSADKNLPGPVRLRALGLGARRGLYPTETIKHALQNAPAHARPSLPQILFVERDNPACLPRFSPNEAANYAEQTENIGVLARFLGENRLETARRSLERVQGASF